MIPEVRRDDGTIVGRSSGWSKRWVRPRLGQIWQRFTCWVFGHDWSPWEEDDYDGPGEELEEGGFMPFCRRLSAPGGYGERTCRRYCGVHEQRYPISDAPIKWAEKVMAQAAEVHPSSIRPRLRDGKQA